VMWCGFEEKKPQGVYQKKRREKRGGGGVF